MMVRPFRVIQSVQTTLQQSDTSKILQAAVDLVKDVFPHAAPQTKEAIVKEVVMKTGRRKVLQKWEEEPQWAAQLKKVEG